MSENRFNFQSELSDHVRNNFFINGQWAAPRTNHRLDLISPVTETLMLQVPEASTEDVDAAVHSAREAFDNGPWPHLTPQERGAYLRKIAHEMRKRESLFVRLWNAQVGAPISFAKSIAPFAFELFEYYADLADTYAFTQERPYKSGAVARMVHEPVGVVGVITPWNAPLILLSYKVAAGLAAGCTIVSKPSPETPLDALLLAECVEAAGLPPGVVNIIPAGRETGDYFIHKKELDKISFTGNTTTGKAIAAACSDRIARVNLELGGKSAAIVLDDANLDEAIPTIVRFGMPFSGQVCFALTRVLVSRKNMKPFMDAFVKAVKAINVGDPAEPKTQIGPLVTRRQFDRVMGYIEKGINEGATLQTGGKPVSTQPSGYYVEPTVFSDVKPDMTIAREEIFGPVVSVIPYDDEDDAIRIANDSSYGLSGAVFTRDPEHGYKVARRIRTGNMSVNGMAIDPAIPAGGYKQSGVGREGGVEGLEAYLECKAVFMPA
jgi:aldehyde dehydrogenase (NAD+)